MQMRGVREEELKQESVRILLHLSFRVEFHNTAVGSRFLPSQHPALETVPIQPASLLADTSSAELSPNTAADVRWLITMWHHTWLTQETLTSVVPRA